MRVNKPDKQSLNGAQQPEKQLGQRSMIERDIWTPDVTGSGTGDQRGQTAGQQAVIDHQDMGQRYSGEFTSFVEAIGKRFFSDT
jgi:hypothetical protein